MQKGVLQHFRKHAGAALIAAVFALLASQALISAHAAKYGDGPHQHDGQVCVLSLAAPGGDKAIAATAFALTVILAVWRAGPFAAQTERAALKVRAARPRGPPSF